MDVLPLDQAIKVAFENRPELRQLDLELKNRDIEIEYAKNQLMPSVNATLAYTQNGVGGTETLRDGFTPGAPILRVIPGGLGNAFGQMFGFNYTGWSIGVDVQIPLRNRAQQADYARAVVDRRAAETRVKAVEQQIILEVRNALTQVQMNKARIETAEVSRELAEQQMNAEQRRYALGASTVRFVLEEQRNFTQMQTNEIAALINYTKALVDYERSIGMTLKKHNVEIEKTLSASR
jgi:outer membrane protein TolC